MAWAWVAVAGGGHLDCIVHRRVAKLSAQVMGGHPARSGRMARQIVEK